MLYYESNVTYTCHRGGTGRRTGFKIRRETMWVRVPPVVPKQIYNHKGTRIGR